MSVPSDLGTLTEVIPKYYEDLLQSSSNIDQIAVYCRNAYSAEGDKYDTFMKTQNYIKDALSNVAYHVHTMGLHLTSYLQAQVNEIERMDLHLQMLSDRIRNSKDVVGNNAFAGKEAVREGHGLKSKSKKLEEHELPEESRPLNRTSKIPLNLRALDGVGIDLTGNKGQDDFDECLFGLKKEAPLYTAPPPSSNPARTSSSQPITQRPAAPSQGSTTMPMPPRGLAPPPAPRLSVPAPPPPMGYDDRDLPPPPPPNF